MTPKDSYKLSDYRDGTPGRVSCPTCGTLLAHDATECYDCGVHFHGGTAYDFVPDHSPARRWFRRVGMLLLWAVLAAMVIQAVFVWL